MRTGRTEQQQGGRAVENSDRNRCRVPNGGRSCRCARTSRPLHHSNKPHHAADVYLLDTAQGKVWQRVQYGDGVYVWQSMWRLDDLAATQSFLQSVLPNLKKGAGTPTTP
jgi:hypothetical protein